MKGLAWINDKRVGEAMKYRNMRDWERFTIPIWDF